MVCEVRSCVIDLMVMDARVAGSVAAAIAVLCGNLIDNVA